MKVRATVMPRGVNATLIPGLLEGRAEPPVGGVERGEGDARHRGGQGEGKVHEGVHETPAGEAVAHEHPAHDQAEDAVDGRGREGRAEGELVRRHAPAAP